MARVTVTDCLEHVDNRFQLVLIASKRARQLLLGAEPLVEHNQDKPTVLALREIAEGLIDASILEESDADTLEFDVSGLEAHFDTGDDDIVDLDALEAGVAGGESGGENMLGESDADSLKGQPDGGAPAVAPPLETQPD